MDATFSDLSMTSEQDRKISATVLREGGRLRSFIRRRVADAAEAEDIVQEVLYELVAAHRLMQPIEQAGAWLLRVARNRIIDRFRRRSTRAELAQPVLPQDDAEEPTLLEELLPSNESGPEAQLMRQLLLEQMEEALDELPREQREVFIAHELEGASFKELQARWGVGINTLLSRKRYAVLALRKRLQETYEEWFDE
ncbi:MAG TPA: sigma-70 family RNA polymerase sigma factor [Steroidobacteraceae bacterium]|nr:sigma-70 family RNA polymerase sigma factor [Steroidobacteraceae bacterium]